MLISETVSVEKNICFALEEGGGIHMQPMAFMTLAETAGRGFAEYYRHKLRCGRDAILFFVFLSVLMVLNLPKILACSPVTGCINHQLKVQPCPSSGVMCHGFNPR